jgi:hypothetical protein
MIFIVIIIFLLYTYTQLLAIVFYSVDGGGSPGPEQGVIQVTAEEKAVIERLEAMGFDHNLVVEAYLACDKNEALAINYMLVQYYWRFSHAFLFQLFTFS